MNKILPIITFCTAILTALLSVCGLIIISFAVGVHGLTLVAVPVLIIGLTLSIANAALSYYLKKSKLCFVSIFINLAAFALSVVSLIIWLAAV